MNITKEVKPKAKGNIHDHNFKHNFSREDVGRDFLRHNLPKKVLRYIDVDTLKVVPNEFLPSKYRGARHTDIIYEIKAQGGSQVYVLVHVEAQSEHDPYMSLRVWEYHVAIARSHLTKNKDKKIPLIVTFVLYNGKERWKGTKSIADLFQDFNLYIDISFKSPFLINLKQEALEKLRSQDAAAAPQIIMKGRATGDYCTLLHELYPLLKKHEQADDENLGYMASTDQHGERQFLENLSKFDNETAKNISNMFETALKKERREAIKIGKDEGIQIGKSKGIQIGRSEGIEIGIQKAVHGMAEEHISADIIARSLKISKKEVDSILAKKS